MSSTCQEARQAARSSGAERDVTRLYRLGGRIIERGERTDAGGIWWPYALVRLGQRRVLVVLRTAPCNDGAA